MLADKMYRLKRESALLGLIYIWKKMMWVQNTYLFITRCSMQVELKDTLYVEHLWYTGTDRKRQQMSEEKQNYNVHYIMRVEG